MGIGIAVLSIGVGTLIWSLRSYIDHGENLSGRTLMWAAAAQLVRDHPWLGVGPGNYSQAFVAGGYAADIPPEYVGLQNAHNMFLHVSVEAGVFATLCLSVFMLWALRACWRTWTSGHTPMLALGMLFALGGFLVHSLSQNFFDARADVERIRLVVWMILAAILALERLPRSVRS